MKFSAYIRFSIHTLVCPVIFGPNASLAEQQNRSSSALLPPSLIVNKAIVALGGKEALESVTGVIYQVANFFRLKTTMENYDFYISDTVIAVSGNQNVTFSYPADGSSILQRIDRNWHLSEEWYFASPFAEPRSFSLVVRGGDDGYACYTEGNNIVYLPATVTQGYVDAGLTNYLVVRATKMSPRLMLQVLADNDTTSSLIALRGGVQRPSVASLALGLTVIFDSETYLPYNIRTVEGNALFGTSDRDLQVYNYTMVNGVKFPIRFTTTYQNAVIEDFEVTDIRFNPQLPSNFFEGLPANNSLVNGPIICYSLANIHGTLSNLSATHPAPGLDKVWNLVFEDSPGYAQLVIEFDDAVFVFDSPPHQSELVIEWVRQSLGKSVTHLWPSHHHHDHAYGTQDFINTGAKLVVPEVAQPFWSALPNASIISYNGGSPFIYRDSTTQLRLVWHEHSAHAADEGYAMVPTACPKADDPIVIFEADTWNPGLVSDGLDEYQARAWLDQALNDALSINAIVAPAHGIVANLTDLINYLEFPYPNLTTIDWTFGGPLC
ncbi:metallo-beta-lactamase superfamily protein [Hyaloscypha variabilis F]|uniref:Metallo-beta-lactamase superfamily protein n=1 Tax=Hyaloscypha variabilis (strain UAMH 11265 / GT02V1 / F) TaxID=1149755 RepID=A0A2J6R7R5_HYAVF|nr:metallo-beta-lactamase superfamily protein [Hyaloscypha variabilis F]